MDAFEAVSLPMSETQVGKKYFSLAEANRALALVRRIVEDVVRNYTHLCELHAACRSFDANGNTAEIETLRQEYASVTDYLSELNEELEKVGCELKDYRLGLVDFPARLAGREVCLCWRLGEDEIAYWHETDGGFAGRRMIGADFV